MQSESQAPETLNEFIHDVGIPNELHTDGAKVTTFGNWVKICKKFAIKRTIAEPYSPWKNPAEKGVKLVKQKASQLMRSTATPLRLWDYAYQYASEIICHSASDMYSLEGVTPVEKVHNHTPDISEMLYFTWYEWVWYHEPTGDDHQKLGRVLGPAYDIGQGLA